MMRKRRCNFGFTLAEILIVVAIIAILTAVAIPIYNITFNKAEKAARDANVRAAKSYAVSEILMNQDKYGLTETQYGWIVNVTITKDGEISNPLITPCTTDKEGWASLEEQYNSYGGYYWYEDRKTHLSSVSFLLNLIDVVTPDTASP